MGSEYKRAILATVGAAILWSIGGLFIKLITIDAFSILFYRSLLAGLTLIIIYGRVAVKLNKIGFISSLFYAPLLILFVTATKLTTAANAIFLQYTAPAIVLVLEPYFFRTKIDRINIWAVSLSMLGMGLFFVDQLSGEGSWLGFILAALSGLVLAGLLISQKLNDPSFIIGPIVWGNVWVCMITFPFVWTADAGPSPSDLLYLVILGIGQLGMGYVLFLYGQKYLSAIESALIAMLEPLLNPMWVVIGYGEIPGIWAIVGGLLIITTLMGRLFIIKQKNKSHRLSI